MSELANPIPPEFLDMLEEGCRNCPIARFTLETAITSGEDPAPLAENIKENCTGWRSEDDPHETILGTDGDRAHVMDAAINENCPYMLTQA